MLNSLDSHAIDDDIDGDAPATGIPNTKSSKSEKKKNILSRMLRKDGKLCLIYPENKYKDNWDMFMAIVLITTCMIAPVRIAFHEEGKESAGWTVFNLTIDFLFFVDIIVIFNTAYYDGDFRIIDERKLICKRYMYGWFLVDVLAIVPFDYFFN